MFAVLIMGPAEKRFASNVPEHVAGEDSAKVVPLSPAT